MTRLLVHVEGQTEEGFVNSVLAPYLYERGYTSVSARLLGNARLRSRRGGIKSWETVKTEVHRHLLHDEGCRATLMVDYYGLPASGQGAWPGRAEAAMLPLPERAAHVQHALQEDFALQSGFATAKRFLPFVILHEFEALLFSDCEKFATGIGSPDLQQRFQSIRDEFGSPEEINDSPETAPSKRILKILPGYQKPLHGNIGALEVGIDRMRAECPHFSEWLMQLEELIAT